MNKITNNNYVMTYEDLKKLVINRLNNNELRTCLALYLLRFRYRNSYGTVHGEEGLNSEFNYSYPQNLVDELDIPIGRYGFANVDLNEELKNDKYIIDFNNNQEIYDYINFNLDIPQREDLIKYLEELFDAIESTSDFDLIDYCHERELYLKYKPFLRGESNMNEQEMYIKNDCYYIIGDDNTLVE